MSRADSISARSDGSANHEPAAHYDRVFSAWRLIMGDEFHYGYFEDPDVPLGEATQALTERMRERAAVAAGDRILDVGCGTGRQSCDLADQFDVSVLGITTSGRGVEEANALATERGLDNARFEQRDGTDNGLADESFDVAWVLESSHLMRDKPALLGECARVLAPGGRIVLCDIIRRREIPFAEVRARRDDFAKLRAVFGDAHMEPLGSYASTLERLGVSVTDSTDITAPTLPTFAAWRANVKAHEPALRDLLGRQGVEDFVQATNIVESLWLDETLGYGILAAVKRPDARVATSA